MSDTKKLIAVVGATGQQGGAVVRALQASAQFKVRALTRNPAKHPQLAEEVVQADLDHPETLKAAFTGAHGIFLVTNFREPGTDERKQALAAVHAAKAAGVQHFMWRGPVTSAAGAIAGGTLTSVTGSWIMDPSSSIGFSGNHAGNDFHGKFTRWSADIRYNPAAPESSSITASIKTGSAADGVPLHEETLPQAEWFNVAKYPNAGFKTTKVSADGAIEGMLTIKDRQLPVTGLKATVDKGVLHITGKFDIARKDADLGQESDAGGDYVSLKIGVDVNVTAKAPQ